MRDTKDFPPGLIAAVVGVAGLVAWPTAGVAQTVAGDASAAQTTVYGLWGATKTVLADTGALADSSDARDASAMTGNVPSLLSGEALSAFTIGWPDQVASVASLGKLGLTVGGTGISADFVMARATASLGATGSGGVFIDNLSIAGLPITVTGEPNQVVPIPGGQVMINEQTVSPSGTTVNALHATVSGVADVVVASATAGIH